MGYTKDYETNHIGLYTKILFKLCLSIKNIYYIAFRHLDVGIMFSPLDCFPAPSGRCIK